MTGLHEPEASCASASDVAEMDDSSDAEEAARRASKWFIGFLDWIWARGTLGKVALFFLLVLWIAPPVFNAYAMYLLWFQFYPIANSLTERLAVLSVLVALANAEALWLQNILIHNLFNAYVNRTMRRTRSNLSTVQDE